MAEHRLGGIEKETLLSAIKDRKLWNPCESTFRRDTAYKRRQTRKNWKKIEKKEGKNKWKKGKNEEI